MLGSPFKYQGKRSLRQTTLDELERPNVNQCPSPPYAADLFVARMPLFATSGEHQPGIAVLLSSGRVALLLSGEIPLNMLNS
jgi:hypothetical protein